VSAGNGAYDAIVIGAGHNGLAAACALAKGGRNVLVLERRDVTGGLCAGEEFHPGYRSAGLLHDTTGMRPWVADALSLHEHGLSRSAKPLEVFSPQREGRGLLLSMDPGEASGEIGQFSSDDVRQFSRHRDFIDRVREVVSNLMNEVPADWLGFGTGDLVTMIRKAVSVRRLGRRDMIDLVRVAPMCVADWLDEWFETELLKSSLAAPAVLGGWVGPRSPGTSTNLLLWECLAGNPIEGGPAAVAVALERAATQLGVRFKTSCCCRRPTPKRHSSRCSNHTRSRPVSRAVSVRGGRGEPRPRFTWRWTNRSNSPVARARCSSTRAPGKSWMRWSVRSTR